MLRKTIAFGCDGNLRCMHAMQLLTIEVLLLIPTMLRYSSRPSKNVAVQGIKNKLDAFISVIVNNMLLNIM